MEEQLKELQGEYTKLCAMLGEAAYRYESDKLRIKAAIDAVQAKHQTLTQALEKKTKAEAKEEPKEEVSEKLEESNEAEVIEMKEVQHG